MSRFFTPGGDVADALARMSAEANLVWFDGHSDYGHSIEKFAENYPDAVGPRTSLLILGDARNNYRATGLATLRGLVQKSRHAYWLNPEPRPTGAAATAPTDAVRRRHRDGRGAATPSSSRSSSSGSCRPDRRARPSTCLWRSTRVRSRT